MSPRSVHNCEIVSQIATGGMAVVYKAVQNSLNRPVAIKGVIKVSVPWKSCPLEILELLEIPGNFEIP